MCHGRISLPIFISRPSLQILPQLDEALGEMKNFSVMGARVCEKPVDVPSPAELHLWFVLD